VRGRERGIPSRGARGMSGAPDVSVIVPTFRRPEALATLLEALATQTDAGRFEAVVVDDGGGIDDRTLRSASENGVRVLERDHGGPGAARNAGAATARGRFLAFTDDDCEPRPDWVEGLRRRLEANPGCAFGGRIVDARPESTFAIANRVIADHLDRWLNDAGRSPRFYPTMNLGLARDRFLSIGGFDESFRLAGGEDRELCQRWLDRGGRLAPAPEAVVVHDHPLDLPGFWRQHMNYGRGARTLRRRRARGDLERPGFYRELLLRGLRHGPRVFALLLVSQAATAVGFARERRRGEVE